MFVSGFAAGLGFSVGVSVIAAAWFAFKVACDYVAGKPAAVPPTMADYHRMSVQQLVERNVIGRDMVEQLERLADAAERRK